MNKKFDYELHKDGLMIIDQTFWIKNGFYYHKMF
jgi:hypothetical protein